MKIVVTGASGFIGRNVLLRAPRDWRITATYRGSDSLKDFVLDNGLSHVTPIRCDLLDPEAVRELARATGSFDVALYLAANSDPAASAERPRYDLEANTVAFVNFLEHCPVAHVVYVSSGAVYDGCRGPVFPGVALSPRLPYAISKLASEQYLCSFSEKLGTVESYVNVRFFGAYGPYEAERKITTRWLRAVMAGAREFVVCGDGRNLIDFMYVDDAVDGLLALAGARNVRLTVDLASRKPVTIDEVVREMARALDVDVAITHVGNVPEYIEFRSVDRTVEDRFGVRSSISFREGFLRLKAFLENESAVPRNP